ncbi:uncharacterized protein LOC131161589 [Malania oleifera]|uniref:uncharacterized protein LOC131161589 n=1 Tax=Malania oleifera TaxID=397392 RepID=UPI0025ADD02E|nr:uncharacterized protein LOC131161589 [Malania oleifera]
MTSGMPARHQLMGAAAPALLAEKLWRRRGAEKSWNRDRSVGRSIFFAGAESWSIGTGNGGISPETADMEWWDKMMLPMQRVWGGVAKRLGIRKSGLLKLRQDVRTCEYEDVRVMWEMLKRNETELTHSPAKRKKRPFWNIFEWAKRAPYLCHSF